MQRGLARLRVVRALRPRERRERCKCKGGNCGAGVSRVELYEGAEGAADGEEEGLGRIVCARLAVRDQPRKPRAQSLVCICDPQPLQLCRRATLDRSLRAIQALLRLLNGVSGGLVRILVRVRVQARR